MSESGKVVVTKTKLDELANRINEKAGSTGPKTIAELTQTVANMPAGVIPEIGANSNWYINGADTGKPSRGETGPQGATGPAGKTPVKGTDYFTDADKQELASQAAGLVDLSGKQDKIMKSGLLKGDGAGGVSTAVPGVDYIAESDLYVCELTYADNQYTCNRTLDEIHAASAAGKLPVIRYDDAIYWLSSSIDTAALFARTDGGSVHIFTVQAPNRASRRSEAFAKNTAVTSSIAPTYTPLNDNIEYFLTKVQSLTFGFPAGNFECWVRLETAASGSISVTFPETAKFIGKTPSFGVGETWELSVKDNVVIALKVSA